MAAPSAPCLEPGWALLSDAEVVELASQDLRGAVTPELLRRLSRRDILALLSAQKSLGGGGIAGGPPEDLPEPSSQPSETPGRVEARARPAEVQKEEGGTARSRWKQLVAASPAEAKGREAHPAENEKTTDAGSIVHMEASTAEVATAKPSVVVVDLDNEVVEDSVEGFEATTTPAKPVSIRGTSEPRGDGGDEAGATPPGQRLLAWSGPRRNARFPLGGRPPPNTCLGSLASGLCTEDGTPVGQLPAGELLLALAGVHPHWALDVPVAAALQELLRPARCKVDERWGLLPHQAEGYQWLMARAESRLGAILADSMGLGKTRQAIAWLLGVRAMLLSKADCDTMDQPQACRQPGCQQAGCARIRPGPALVLAPAVLVRGNDSLWVQELLQAASLWQTPLKVWQCIAERSCDLQTPVTVGSWRGPMVELYDVVITSYETALANQDQFCAQDWTCVICDEAQAIKRHAAQTSAAVKKLARAPYRLALTGSPVENSLDDLHSILEFVQPDCAGSLRDFRQRFPQGAAARDALGRLLQALVLRREPGGLVKMVPKEDLDVPVSLSPTQRELYDAALLRHASAMRRFRSLELLCSHPWCMAELASKEVRHSMPERFLCEASKQRVEDSGKMEELFNILRGLLALGEKVIVFVCRTVTSRLLSALITRELGDRAGIIRGDTDLAERERVLRLFRAEPTPGVPPMQVLLLSVWVGAVGLNLPEARWVVHFERVWNPAREWQATSRAHRLTSTRPVKAYCLYTEGTVEEYKRDVLMRKRELSSDVIRALDARAEALEALESAAGPVDGEDAEETALSEVQELVDSMAGPCAGKAGAAEEAVEWAGSEPDVLAEDSGDGTSERAEDSEEDEEELPQEHDCAPHPSLGRLKPRRLGLPFVGKYGDPCDQELWHWYCDEGHREVHPRAIARSTAGLEPVRCQPAHRQLKARPLASRPSRQHDPRERRDVEVPLVLGGFRCHLFIPEKHQHHFEGISGAGPLKIRPPCPGAVPFPVLMPSTGRSASDSAVGLLDLSATMVAADGSPLDYLQIVAVKPSEVEKYRASAPFFTVLAMASTATVQHPTYGPLGPEELGVGCARHWLLRLADALGAPAIFMLDDSVMSWRGVTLASDPHSLFGRTPGRRVQFSPLSLGQLLLHHAEPRFLSEEFPKFSLLGFARYRPEMFAWRVAYRRSPVYSAFLVNVHKVLHQQGLNFRQDLYIWEDIQLNLDALDVCKCYRFAMIKKRFHSGGCSKQIAHTENPVVVCGALKKMTPEAIVAEAMGDQKAEESAAGGSAATDDATVHSGQRRGRKRGRVSGERSLPKAADQVAATVKAETAELLRLEDHPSLQPQSAVCDEEGNLIYSYYRALIQPFRDREGAMALVRPGFRDSEEPPEGVKLWDDTRRKTNRYAGLQDVCGAGWIAHLPYRQNSKSSSRWFNVKVWGSWRLVFLLARLQRALWEERKPPSFVTEVRPEAEGTEGVEEVEAGEAGCRGAAASSGSTTPSHGKRGRPRGSTRAAAAKPKGLLAYFSAAATPEKESAKEPAGPVQAGLARYFAGPVKMETSVL